MWRLKVGEGSSNRMLRSTNGHVGRQVWEFDPAADDPEEVAAVEAARLEYANNRHQIKNSSDLLMRMQVYLFSLFILSKFQLLCTCPCVYRVLLNKNIPRPTFYPNRNDPWQPNSPQAAHLS
jgi:hypothetical protein